MQIRGLIKFSLIDFPGRLSCVVFVGACNMRCPFCQNPHLVFDPESQPEIPHDQFFAFLDNRKGKLDGVVITGGEPTLFAELPEFAAKIKAMGFDVKIDTNGTNPEMISYCHQAGTVDYLGLDFKAPLEKYIDATRCHSDNAAELFSQNVTYAVEQNIPMTVRTTVHQSLLSEKDLKQMRAELDGFGISQWTLQQFNAVDVIDEELSAIPTYSDSELMALAARLSSHTKAINLAGNMLS